MFSGRIRRQKFKGMTRTYFDRFCWEVEQQKERLASNKTKVEYVSNQINLIINGEHKKVYWGRGSFSFVKVQLYRGLKVAVKEFLLRCIKEDV